MKILRTLDMEKNSIVRKVSFLENEQRQIQIQFSLSCDQKTAYFEYLTIKGFLDLSKAAPGEISCDFEVAYEPGEKFHNLIFTGNLKNALTVLGPEILSLKLFIPAIERVSAILKDRDELEIQQIMQDKQPPIKSQKRTSKENTPEETRPLLNPDGHKKTIFVK